jgi:hypothetical protein
VPEKKPKPPQRSVEQLQTALENASHLLMLAQRAHSTAKSALSAHLISGDEDAIAQCGQEIISTSRQVAQHSNNVESYGQAVEAAKARDRSEWNAQRHGKLQQLMAAAVRDHGGLEEAIVKFGAAMAKARASAQAVEIELQRANVTYDRFLSLATQMLGRVDMSLWLESEGVIGRGPSLDTPMELRQSGRASLKLAVREFRGFIFKSLGIALDDTDDQPDEAA